MSLVRQLPLHLQNELEFRFDVIQDTDVKAFAYPGGKIFITTQLLKQMRSTKQEIAAVLGHEIGHVVSRHSQKSIIKENILGWIISALTRQDNDGYDESFGENVHEMLMETVSKLGELSFSRKDEYEADSRGVETMIRAGYDPRGMISFFEKLLHLERADGGAGNSVVEKWFSTHPGTEERITALKKVYLSTP